VSRYAREAEQQSERANANLCFPFRCSTSLLFHSYPRQAKSSNGEPLGIVAAGFTDQTAVPTSTNIKALKGTKCQYNT